MNKNIGSTLLIAFSVFTNTAFAADYMTADKIKSVIIGNTAYAEHLSKGIEFKVYFDKDGSTAYRTKGDDVVKTTYKFDGNQHCIFWKGKDRCADILDNGDGTYFRVKGGDNKLKWHKIVPGKDL